MTRRAKILTEHDSTSTRRISTRAQFPSASSSRRLLRSDGVYLVEGDDAGANLISPIATPP
jgi:hypothetical protein